MSFRPSHRFPCGIALSDAMEFKSSKDYVHSIIKNPGILLRRPSFWPAPLRASALASLAPFYQSQSVHVAISTILCLLFLCTLVYIVSWLRFSIHRSSRQPGRVPPTIPYMIPFAGSAFSFVLNPSKCVEAATYDSFKYLCMGMRRIY